MEGTVFSIVQINDYQIDDMRNASGSLGIISKFVSSL